MKTLVQPNRSHPLKSLCDQWLLLLTRAKQEKYERFEKYAEEARKFYDGGLKSMWDEGEMRGNGGFLDKQGGTLPNFRMIVNKPFEAVSLFVPTLCHQNPNVMVTPRLGMEIAPEALGIDSQDPMGMQQFQMLEMQEHMQQSVRTSCANVKQTYLNGLQSETDKVTQSRRGISQAIVDGLGVVLTEMYTPPASQIKMPRSMYLKQQDLLVDPDADYWEDVQWIAIRRRQPVNLVERKFNVPEGTLKGNVESLGRQATMDTRSQGEKNNKRRGGISFDLLEYWEIYSKNGMGDKLKRQNTTTEKQQDLSMFGDYCYLALADNTPFPLNLPSDALDAEDGQALIQRVQWETPFWEDSSHGGGWPISRLSFYESSDDVWPIGLFKPVIAELRFVNWCMSFLADKVASSATTYLGMMKDAGVQIQKQIAGNFSPYTIIEVSNILGKKLSECVEFLQAPTFSVDIWHMVSEVLELIDKRTGLSELMYGMQATQDRSAAATKIKQGNNSVRPDDMASRVEDWMSQIAKREMQAARFHCQAPDVAPSVGQMGAMVWENLILTADTAAVFQEYDYRIEAGSARKPNKESRVSQLNEFGQAALPTMQAALLAGQPGPWNAFMEDMGKAMDIDASRYLVQPPPQQNGPSPEEQQAQVEIEAKQQEIQLKGVQGQMDIAQKQMEMQIAAASAQQEISATKELNILAVEKAKADISLTKQKAKAAKSKPKAKGK